MMIISAAASLALASSTADRGASELKTHVTATEQALRAKPKASELAERIKILQSFRSYVQTELQKQQSLTQPDAADDMLALELIGLDDDLGLFLDQNSLGAQNFTENRCIGYHLALIHSYAGADSEDLDPESLPSHAQEVLKLLKLLCG
jgi:hypothetical protein